MIVIVASPREIEELIVFAIGPLWDEELTNLDPALCNSIFSLSAFNNANDSFNLDA